MQHLTILTGASRGMGLAMARQLSVRGASILCISRTRSDELQAWADAQAAVLTQWSADLADPAPVAQRLRSWLSTQGPSQLGSATLINNAGVIGHLGPLELGRAQDIADGLRIGLEAPMQLCAAFLAATGDWTMPRKILNISSGLGRRAMAGTAVYCAAKAGMDHFSRCVALDEGRHAQGARIVSLAPGVIDTDMQSELRAGDPQVFPDRDNFVRLQQTASLMLPAMAAQQVLTYLARPDFGEAPVADVRDA